MRVVTGLVVLMLLAGTGREASRVDRLPQVSPVAARRKPTEAQWAELANALQDLHATVRKAKHRVADWRARWIRYQFADGRRGSSYPEIVRSIRSAVDRWPVPGGVGTAVRIAQCESGLRAEAENPSGASGVYQVVDGTWGSWWSAMVQARPGWQRLWRLRPSVYNARSNVVLSIIHAHRYGWGAWGCA